MKEIDTKMSYFFKAPFGSLKYEDYHLGKVLDDFFVNLFSISFWKFYFRMSKFSFVKYPRLNGLKILKKFLYIYRVSHCNRLRFWKTQDIVSCFQVVKAWGEGNYHSEIIRLLNLVNKG